MDKLEILPPVQRLSERVLRVLGQNPGKFTLQGTNTYIIGLRAPYVLLDTGEGKPEYVPHLEDVLKQLPESTNDTPLISDIIISHEHRDHWGGLDSVLSLLRKLAQAKSSNSFHPPKIHKYPNNLDANLESYLKTLPLGSFVHTDNEFILHELDEKETLQAGDTTLQIFHTPGHTDDSICILLHEESALFTADSVLGQGTAVFRDLKTYLASLQKMLDVEVDGKAPFSTLYPGHGPVLHDGRKHIKEYIEHRLQREREILNVLRSPPINGGYATVMDIVSHIYAAYPQSLWQPASYGVHLHLLKLREESRVEEVPGPDIAETKWKASSIAAL
ncbi:Metallo-hydrolase/oxidoreductase [Sistotremastrum suecicum HHB10207 ss-3]|uniref:Metallo-hydrolase/oxidoreductase n=1 Tax=Sistotremastrum suecicum HHB10207 ss-3 TaxID=1314776 RepID=A0A165Y0K0_9AGAM|nr:Metallo-hydrolase/oxidoreductase [Sistotremastrum suecicum HHB10207 ss-3]